MRKPSITFGSDRLYFAGQATYPEHNGTTWETVTRDLYVSRDIMHPKTWNIHFHMGGSIFCPCKADFRSKADAMYHCLAMQAESFR